MPKRKKKGKKTKAKPIRKLLSSQHNITTAHHGCSVSASVAIAVFSDFLASLKTYDCISPLFGAGAGFVARVCSCLFAKQTHKRKRSCLFAKQTTGKRRTANGCIYGPRKTKNNEPKGAEELQGDDSLRVGTASDTLHI